MNEEIHKHEAAETKRPRNYHELHPNPALPSVYPYDEALARPIIEKVKALRKENAGKPSRVIVALDGRCGSGKTSIAALLTRIFKCDVIHMDGHYLPFSRRKPDWEAQHAGNIDLAGVKRALLASSGEVLILEGSYAHHPSLWTFPADKAENLSCVKVFVTCAKEEQARRLLLREGAHFAEFERLWIPLEERYFADLRVEEKSDLRICTDPGGEETKQGK